MTGPHRWARGVEGGPDDSDDCAPLGGEKGASCPSGAGAVGGKTLLSRLMDRAAGVSFHRPVSLPIYIYRPRTHAVSLS